MILDEPAADSERGTALARADARNGAVSADLSKDILAAIPVVEARPDYVGKCEALQLFRIR